MFPFQFTLKLQHQNFILIQLFIKTQRLKLDPIAFRHKINLQDLLIKL